jgi:hypothetical protein
MSFPPLVDEFMQEERWHCDDIDQNLFASAVAQIGRYCGFLPIIHSRVQQELDEYRRLAAARSASMDGEVRQLGVEEIRSLEVEMCLSRQIHLNPTTSLER